eukprot:1036246-Rhodomonas_salina.2
MGLGPGSGCDGAWALCGKEKGVSGGKQERLESASGKTDEGGGQNWGNITRELFEDQEHMTGSDHMIAVKRAREPGVPCKMTEWDAKGTGT